MPYFQQELFILAQATARDLMSPEYLMDVETVTNLGGRDGIDATLEFYGVDALFTITRGTACTLDLINGDRFFVGSSTPGAIVGYPTVTVPAGYVFGLPIGVSFFASAWSEPTLIKFAYAFEQALQARRAPRFLPTIEFP
jgi:amidase